MIKYICQSEDKFFLAAAKIKRKGLYMQNKLSQGRLLDENGNLVEAGYAFDLVKDYSRADVKASKLRLKEWDYYIITDGKKAVALTIDDNGYMSLASVSYLDFQRPFYITKSVMGFMPLGKIGMPSSFKEGNAIFDGKKVKGSFLKQTGKRILKFYYPKFDGEKDFSCEFTLTDEPKEKIVIATPFHKPKHFYYNAKINCMRAEGFAKIGDKTFEFSKEDSLATLDWGRGVWTYKNEWYWGSMQCYLEDGARFGWNIGYGFGDTSKASENMLFTEDVAHKLDKVVFDIPKTSDGKGFDYSADWNFYSNDGRFKMHFKPIIDRYDYTNAIVLSSLQHQVFGVFSGEAVLDDGTVIYIKDKIGFAEHVKNKW